MSAQSNGIRRFSVATAVALLLALPGAAQAQHGGHHGGHSSHHGGSHGHRTNGGHGSRHYSGGEHFGHPSFHFHSYGYYPCNLYPYYYPYGYPYARPYYRGYGRYYPDSASLGALDLDIRPARTAVYEDSRYLGTVDDFDGFPSYLWLTPGTHELAFHLEGYRTVIRRYSIAPGRIVQVEDVLERGESVSPENLGTEDRRWSAPPSSRRRELGRLRLEVTPGDASVYLDGRFVGTGEEFAATDLTVEPGEHVLEVVRPGYQTQTRRFKVTSGDRLDQQMDLDQ